MKLNLNKTVLASVALLVSGAAFAQQGETVKLVRIDPLTGLPDIHRDFFLFILYHLIRQLPESDKKRSMYLANKNRNIAARKILF